jgi:hypothetical protein
MRNKRNCHLPAKSEQPDDEHDDPNHKGHTDHNNERGHALKHKKIETFVLLISVNS